MYKYIYIESKTEGFLQDAEHRELINKYSQEGWRFVAAIPNIQNGHGVITVFDLVFEKEER